MCRRCLLLPPPSCWLCLWTKAQSAYTPPPPLFGRPHYHLLFSPAYFVSLSLSLSLSLSFRSLAISLSLFLSFSFFLSFYSLLYSSAHHHLSSEKRRSAAPKRFFLFSFHLLLSLSLTLFLSSESIVERLLQLVRHYWIDFRWGIIKHQPTNQPTPRSLTLLFLHRELPTTAKHTFQLPANSEIEKNLKWSKASKTLLCVFLLNKWPSPGMTTTTTTSTDLVKSTKRPVGRPILDLSISFLKFHTVTLDDDLSPPLSHMWHYGTVLTCSIWLIGFNWN